MDHHTVVTNRLRLVPISLADEERLAVLHADQRVMSLLRHGVLTRAQSNAAVADYAAERQALGLGCWTATERVGGRLIGLGGLRVHEGDYGVALRFALVPEAQGQGYGSELGRAALSFAFDVVGLERVIAITRADNLPAQRSLEKLGMTRERVFGGDSGKSLLLYAAISPRQVSRPA